ncbi:MAG: uracil-DNA glycosylase family protein, partial [Planctomycetota bacterium]
MSDQAEHNVSRPNRDPERARRVLAQHAETARLLGVDFIPVRSGTGMSPVANSGNANPAGSKAAQQPANEAPQQTPRTETTPKADSASREPASPEQASPKQASHAPATPAANLSPEQSAAQARLDALRARYEADAPHQHFVTDFNNIVFGEGDPCARLMFIGEAPGANEDAAGRPFVGRAGQLLEKMIVAMGLSRDTVYICNVLKTRPPNNQTPTTKEAALCAPYLVEQISIVDPEVIVVLGLFGAHIAVAQFEP